VSKSKIGRPPAGPRGTARDHVLPPLRLSEIELNAIREAAEAEACGVSELARRGTMALVNASRRRRGLPEI
jgi:hypothetical protein